MDFLIQKLYSKLWGLLNSLNEFDVSQHEHRTCMGSTKLFYEILVGIEWKAPHVSDSHRPAVYDHPGVGFGQVPQHGPGEGAVVYSVDPVLHFWMCLTKFLV